MKIKLILILSLFGIVLAVANIWLISLSNYWTLCWIIHFLCIYLIIINADSRYFLHGFLVSFLIYVWTTIIFFIFLSSYISHHEGEIAFIDFVSQTPPATFLKNGIYQGAITSFVVGFLTYIVSRFVNMVSRFVNVKSKKLKNLTYKGLRSFCYGGKYQKLTTLQKSELNNSLRNKAMEVIAKVTDVTASHIALVDCLFKDDYIYIYITFTDQFSENFHSLNAGNIIKIKFVFNDLRADYHSSPVHYHTSITPNYVSITPTSTSYYSYSIDGRCIAAPRSGLLTSIYYKFLRNF